MSERPKESVGSDPAFVTASHAVLFQDEEAHRCDVCSDALAIEGADTEANDSGYDVRGRGLLVWSRGEERRYQEPPLAEEEAEDG